MVDATEPSTDALDLRAVFVEAWEICGSQAVGFTLTGAALLLGMVFSLGILAGPLTVGFIMFVDGYDARMRPSPAVLKPGFDRFAGSFFAAFLQALGSIVGGFLMVLPGVIFCFLSWFALHFVALADKEGADALVASWELVRRNASTILLMIIGMAIINCLGLLTIVGVFFTIPLSLTYATLVFRRLHPGEPRAASN